jgi:hypothetical protein
MIDLPDLETVLGEARDRRQRIKSEDGKATMLVIIRALEALTGRELTPWPSPIDHPEDREIAPPASPPRRL